MAGLGFAGRQAVGAVEDQIAAALEKHAVRVEPVRFHLIRAVLRNGADIDTLVELNQRWVSFVAPLPSPTDETPQATLARAGGFRAGARLALSAGDQLQARVDLAGLDSGDLAERIAAACGAIKEAAASLHHRAEPKAEPEDQAEPAAAAAIEQLCDACRWPTNRRRSGQTWIDLEVGGNFAQALVEPNGAGLRLRAALSEPAAVAESGRRATALLLLRLAARTRLVRPITEEADGKFGTSLEVCWVALPEAAELGEALASLSVAYRHCVREVNLLQQSSRAAEAYLALTAVSHNP